MFVVDAVGTIDASVLLYELREAGLSADRSYGGRALKRQLAAADKSGAAWSVMLLPKEWAAGQVKVKEMASGKELEVARSGRLVANAQDETPT